MPLAIDLFCGLGGWTEGLQAEGYRVVGFDCEQHVYGEARYPAQLVIQDVLTLHGSQFRDAALIVASPPCQEFSYMAMPWTRAKEKAAALRDGRDDPKRLTALFDACFRIQRESSEAAGHLVPLVVENVCGAQKWVGHARWHYGSFYLWGDVPALMPITTRRTAIKVGDVGWRRDSDKPSLSFTGQADLRLREGMKGVGGWFGNYAEQKQRADDGVKQGGDWFNASQPSISRRCSSKSSARKAASAHIAKIPYELARWIARAWWPL